MNKIRKTLVVVFSALFVLCIALFGAACNTGAGSDAEAPDAPKSAYSVSVDVNDASLGTYTLTAANDGEGYTAGTPVTITVQPNEDYEAVLLVNGTEVALTDNAYTFVIGEDTKIEVNYITFAVYTSVTAGKGAVTLSQPADGMKYKKGETVTVTVTPEQGYALKSLQVNGELVAVPENTATFTVTGKTYVFAEFVALRTITVENTDAEKGTVQITQANGTTVESGAVIAEGTELTLTVATLKGNTVKAVYVAGAYTVLDAEGKAVFTVKGDTAVKVIYNTYYYIAIPDDSEGGTISLSGGEKVGALGYLEGTKLTLTVTPKEGYVIQTATMVIGGKETPVPLNYGKYTFTVTEAVEFRIVFAAYEEAVTQKVTVAFNNSNYGTAALVGADANQDGTYYYGTALTLAVDPNPGYMVEYVTVNGKKVTPIVPEEPQEGGEEEVTDIVNYAIEVKEDIEIYVCFAETERYTVRVEMPGLTDQLTVTLGGAGLANVNDDFIKAECYEGQEIAFIVSLIEGVSLDGNQIFYYINDAAERTIYAEEVAGEGVTVTVGTQDITILITVEAPKALEIGEIATTVSNDAGGTAPAVTYTAPTAELKNGQYVLTLTKPAYPEGYLFKAWTVTCNGEAIEVVDGVCEIPYDESGMAIEISADWVVAVGIQVTSATAEGEVQVEVDGVMETVGTAVYAEKGAAFTITATPKEGQYRVKTFTYQIGEGTEQDVLATLEALPYGAVTVNNGTLTDALTVTVEYQQIFAITLEATRGDAAIEVEADGFFAQVETTYYVDKDANVTITVTPTEGYLLDNATVKVGTVENKIEAENGVVTFTGAASANIVVTVVTRVLVAVNVGFDPEEYTETFTLIDTKTEIAYEANKQVIPESTAIKLTLGNLDQYSEITVKVDGEAITAEEDGSYIIQLLYNDVTVTITLVPVLNVTFPPVAPGSTTNEADDNGGVPVQGQWKSVGASENAIEINAHTMVVNGEEVTEIASEGADGDIKYTLTTETNTYTLTWFGGVEGFILMLTSTPSTQTARLAARLVDEAEAPAPAYYVNPKYADSYFGKFGKVGKSLLGIEWTAQDGTVIEVTDETGAMHVSITTMEGETATKAEASYVFYVEEGHWLFVVGTTAYDMTVGEHLITVNGVDYVDPNVVIISAFHNAGIITDGTNIQLVLRFSATGYKTAEQAQGDLKVIIGEGEENVFECYLAQLPAEGSDVVTAYFHIDPSKLALEDGGSAQIVLVSAATNKTYEAPATRADDTKATFGDDTYTLKYEEGALTITLTKEGQGGGDVEGTDIAFGEEGVSVTSNDWRYWNDQMWPNSRVEVSVAKLTANDAIRLVAKCTEGACDWGLQLFYNNVTDYQKGKAYILSVTILSATDCEITLNGKPVSLEAGVAQTVTVSFVYEGELSLFDMQVKVANGNDYDLTLTNIKWQEDLAGDELGELVEGELSQELVQSEEGKEKDKFILWYPYEAWDSCGSVVTLQPAVAEVYKEGKIAFEYKGGSTTWSVQLFYSNTHLQNGVEYWVTLKIKLTAAADVNVQVNSKQVTLKAGQVNDVKVRFVNTTETEGNKGISSLDIQFPGTELLEGIESVGIEITDVAWYNIKTQGPDVPTEKSLTVTAAKVEKVDDKAYFVFTADTTGYTEADLKSFVIYNNKEITVDQAKSQFVVNGASTFYFDITSLTNADSWYWLHLKINGENWNGTNGNIDYNSAVKDEKIECGNYRYYLKQDNSPQVIIVIEELNFVGAHLEVIEGKVYYVLDTNLSQYSEEQIKKSVLYDGTKGQDGYRAFTVDSAKFAPITEGFGRFRLYFDITSLTGDRFYPHILLEGAGDNGADIGIGDVKCGFDAQKGIVTNNKIRYTMASAFDMPCVDILMIPDNFYETTKVELIARDNKAYLILTGTYTGYEKDALQGVLEELYIDLQNNPYPEGAAKDGRDDWAVYVGFPRVVTVENGGTWKIELEVTMGMSGITYKDKVATEWKNGAYTAHFGVKNDAGDAADLKVQDALDGQTVTINNIVYTLHNYFGSGDQAQYFGCIGLSIVDPTAVKKDAAIDYSTIHFEEEGGKVYLVISGTNENCTKEDLVFDVENTKVGSGRLYPAFTFDDSQSGKFTIKVDLSTVPGVEEYYMHFIVMGSGLGNVATQTNEGYNVAKVGIYEIEIRNTGWGPWSWILKVGEATEVPEVKTTVTFNVDSNTEQIPTAQYDEGQTFTAPQAPSKANYKFMYWYYMNGDVEEQVGDGFVPSDHDDENHALTLYAKWQFDLTIGTPDNMKGYPANTPDYSETLNKGEIVTFSGTMTSQGADNWNGPLLFIFSTPIAWGNMRADNWINATVGDGDHVTISEENFIINKDVPPPHWEEWTNMLKAASLTITFNWEFDNVIYISIMMRGNNGVTNGIVYSVTPTEGNVLKDSYTIGFGCEESYLVMNERKANLVTAHTNHTYTDGICTECGAVQPAAQVPGGTVLDISWQAEAFNTRKWTHSAFAKGSKIAVYGTQTKETATDAWASLVAEVDFLDTAKSVTLRTDNYGWYFDNSGTSHLVEGARKESYLKIAKNYGEMFVDWNIVKNILVACDYCVEFDWTGNDIVVTMTFTATSGTAVGYTYVQQYTVNAHDAQTVDVRFGTDQAAGTAAKVVVS